MASPRPDRRAFLTVYAPKPRVLAVSCERLYIRYLDARRANRFKQFLAALTAEVEAADQLHLSDREWLGREDFRTAVQAILQRRPDATCLSRNDRSR